MIAAFDIEPIGPTIGAEIHGLDLSRQIDRATADALEAALVEHKVIFARDQHITTAQQVAFGRLFGELEVHPFCPEGDFPEIMVLDNQGTTVVLAAGRKFQVLGRNRIETRLERVWPLPAQETLAYAPPIADDNCVYLRGERYLYCI